MSPGSRTFPRFVARCAGITAIPLTLLLILLLGGLAASAAASAEAVDASLDTPEASASLESSESLALVAARIAQTEAYFNQRLTETVSARADRMVSDVLARQLVRMQVASSGRGHFVVSTPAIRPGAPPASHGGASPEPERALD